LALLHEAEGKLTQENLLVALEQTTGNPLVDGHADSADKGLNPFDVVLACFRLGNGFVEEDAERLK
jgi:hypothetical protein